MNIPILPIKNMAPIEPLLGLKDGNYNVPAYIGDGLKELLQDILQRDKDVWKEIANTAEVVSNFIQGKQLWRKNYWNNTWTIQPVNLADANRITSINIMQFYCTSQMKMMTASNPDLEPAEEFKRSQLKEDVRIAKAIWNKYESKFYTPWLNNQEALHAIVSGTYIEEVYYDYMKNSGTVFHEIFEEKEIEISPGYSKCFECEQEGPYSDFTRSEIPSCPNCGSMEILPPEPPITQKFNTVAGLQPIQTGDLSLRLIPLQAVRFDVSKRLEESPWMLYRQTVPRSYLKHILGKNVPVEDAYTDAGLKSLISVSKAGNTLSGMNSFSNESTKAGDSGSVIIDRLSLSPADYCHIVAGKDEKTIDGETIKKGTKLTDLCPEGMTVFSVNNGEYVLGIYPNVHHSQGIATGVYHMRYESGLGRGSDDTVEVQKRFLRLDAQNVRFLETAATPANIYVKGAVDKGHLKSIGKPGANIPINPEVAQAFNSLDVVKQLQPGNIAAQYFQYTYDILNQYRQLTSHSTDFTNAFPGVDNRTATGAKLAKANADSIYSPFLQLKSEVRRTIAGKTVTLYKHHFSGVKQFMSFGENATGQTIGEMIDGDDVNETIEFAVVRDSEQPKTPLDRQLDLVNLMTVVANAGGLEQIKAMDPELYDACLRAFDIDINENTYSTIIDICETRLEQALALLEQYNQIESIMAQFGVQPPMVDPSAVLLSLSPSIKLEEPSHEQKMKWFMDYLDTPEGADLDDMQREVVAVFVRTHAQLYMQQQAAMAAGFAQVQAAGMGPQMEAQQQQQEQDRNNAIEDDQRNKAHERDMKQADIENENRKVERDQQWATEQANQAAMNAAAQSALDFTMQDMLNKQAQSKK